MPDTTQGLAIVGPGLIGTSIGLAAKRRWPDLQIHTVDRGDSLSAIGNCLVIVLSAPVHAILDAIPQLPPMNGSVLVVDPKWKFVVLDLGENVGLRKNGVFMVSREGKLISKVKVRQVDPERSIADILPGWSVSEVREGDRVLN